MELLYCECEIGCKYYTIYEGRIRACFFIGTECDASGIHYIADVAGIGEVNIPFADRQKSFDKWYRGKSIDSIFAESPEQILDGEFVQAYYGSCDNSYNTTLFKQFVPELNYGDSGVSPWGWKFNMRTLQPYQEWRIPWKYWRIDSNGFHHDINLNDIYNNEQDCRNAYAEMFEPVEF